MLMIFMNEKVVQWFYFIIWKWVSKCIFEVLYKNNEFFKKEDNSFSLVWQMCLVCFGYMC